MSCWTVAAVLCAGGCAGSTSAGLGPPEDLDPSNPFVLNELAAGSLKRGDLDSARVLLERAARLAPHDPRISANLIVVRAAGRGTPPNGPNPIAPDPNAPASALAEPPRIWESD